MASKVMTQVDCNQEGSKVIPEALLSNFAFPTNSW